MDVIDTNRKWQTYIVFIYYEFFLFYIIISNFFQDGLYKKIIPVLLIILYILFPIIMQYTTILFQRTTCFTNWNQLEDGQFECFNEHESICGYHAIHLETGERCIFPNPIYKELLRFQTMDPKSMFHYLCLRRTFQIKQYLEFFPKFRKKYKLLKEHFDSFIHNLHQAYLTKYVFKTPILGNKYVIYVESIHRDIYIKSLSQGKKIPITRKVVHDYIMTKHPGEILYILFTEKRNITKIA